MTDKVVHLHPATVAHRDERSFKDKAADGIADALGSWTFLLVQTIIVAAWMIYNRGSRGFDPYPWIFLNLMFSLQAAYAAPVLQLAQNRQTARDRRRDDHDYLSGQESLRLVRLLVSHLELEEDGSCTHCPHHAHADR